MPGPSKLITEPARINREFDAREQQRREAAQAYTEGGLAYHAAIRDISDEPAKEAAAREAFGKNPYGMVSYADEGHQRPQWFSGFNDAMAALYGVRTPLWKLSPRDDVRPPELNGRSASTNDQIESYEQAVLAAERVSDVQKAQYWAEDRGPNVSPRFAIIRAFSIGEPVSYGFNGDSYIAGRIVHMSAMPKGASKAEAPRIIVTQDTNGVRRQFFRRRKTGAWVNKGTWSLHHGWHNDRNPSF